MDPHVPSPRIQKKCILHARAHDHLAIRTAWHPMFPMPTHRIVLLPHQSLFIFFPRPHHFIPSFTRHHFPITFHFTCITLGHIAGPILILKPQISWCLHGVASLPCHPYLLLSTCDDSKKTGNFSEKLKEYQSAVYSLGLRNIGFVMADGYFCMI